MFYKTPYFTGENSSKSYERETLKKLAQEEAHLMELYNRKPYLCTEML